jgi:hypothetical protein
MKTAQPVIPTVRNVYESKEKQLTKGPSQDKVRQLEEAKEKARAQQREKKGGMWLPRRRLPSKVGQ